MPGQSDNTILRYGLCKFGAYGGQNGTRHSARRIRDVSVESTGMELINADKTWLGSPYDVIK